MRTLYFKLAHLLRLPLYLTKKVTIGKSPRIERGVFLSKSKVGSYVYVGHYAVIDQAEIGNYCSIAAGVTIGGTEHPYWKGTTSFRIATGAEKPVTKIQDDVWIGAKATIRAGISVGRGAVIGAHALVLKDVPDYAIAVGIPARILKYRFDRPLIEDLTKSRFWETDPTKAREILATMNLA
jgi:acetyltransferase-like isoleucine patch superfamily enzyme